MRIAHQRFVILLAYFCPFCLLQISNRIKSDNSITLAFSTTGCWPFSFLGFRGFFTEIYNIYSSVRFAFSTLSKSRTAAYTNRLSFSNFYLCICIGILAFVELVSSLAILIVSFIFFTHITTALRGTNVYALSAAS